MSMIHVAQKYRAKKEDKAVVLSQLDSKIRELDKLKVDYQRIADAIVQRLKENEGFESRQPTNSSSHYEIGDIVMGTVDCERKDLIGVRGKVIKVMHYPNIGVEWEKHIEGYDCNDNSKYGYGNCWTVDASVIRKVVEEKPSEHVRTKDDYQKFKEGLVEKFIESESAKDGHVLKHLPKYNLGDQVIISKSSQFYNTQGMHGVGHIASDDGWWYSVRFPDGYCNGYFISDLELAEEPKKKMSREEAKSLVARIIGSAEDESDLQGYESKKVELVRKSIPKLISIGFSPVEVQDYFKARDIDVSGFVSLKGK